MLRLVITAGFALTAAAQIPPPSGALVDIGGRSLHLYCRGEGSPTVILEAGFPGSSLDWMLVQPAASKMTRVCSYDRAGFGWSDLADAPRSGAEIVEDLHKLLQAAAVAPPYVLVGHSLGGIYVRMFAAQYPRDVVGMVLVDASHEDQWDFKPVRKWIPTEPAEPLPAKPEVVRPEAQSRILKLMWQTERWKTAEQRERNGLNLTFAAKLPKRLPLIPLLVLSAGRELSGNDIASDDRWKWQQLQKELAASSALGRWLPLEGANHYIHLSKPDHVVGAINRVVAFARHWKRAPE